MKKRITILTIAAAILVIVGSSVVSAGNSGKSKRGNLQENASVSCWQSHSYPDGTNDAGAIILSDGQIEGVGRATTELSMAYTWDFYFHNKNALLYSDPMTMDDIKDYTAECEGTFETTATLTVTTEDGDILVMDIVHGVVHEGPSNGIGGTTNEWLIGLEVNGTESTGRFTDEIGTGHIRLVVDSNNIPDILGSKKYVSAYEVFLKLGEVLIPPVEE